MRLAPTAGLLGCLYPLAWLALIFAGPLAAIGLVVWLFPIPEGSPLRFLIVPTVVVAGVVGVGSLYGLSILWRVIPARCRSPGCLGLAYLHGDFLYRCALCGSDNTDTVSKMSGNWRPDWIERFSHERIAPVLRSLSRRNPEGRLSLASPLSMESKGALSDAAQPGAISLQKEDAERGPGGKGPR